MDFVLDLLQGAGIAAAVGIRPFLPVLLVGALAAADLGIDFDGTDFTFLEEWPFLLAVVVLVALGNVMLRRTGPDAEERRAVWGVALGLALILGMLEACGSLADGGHPVAPGLIAGALCTGLGFFAARSLFGRVRRRLDPQAAAALPVYAEGTAVAVAGLSVLFPPLALLVIGGLVWLLAGGRRREGEKYAGLRVLR
jgi:hypothetical protein